MVEGASAIYEVASAIGVQHHQSLQEGCYGHQSCCDRLQTAYTHSMQNQNEAARDVCAHLIET